MKHHWKPASAHSIKCDAGHYISRAFMSGGAKAHIKKDNAIYTLHLASGKRECFETVNKAKERAEES